MRATNESNKNKGITLIALVITIIVMLILVAVTISMAVNGGLFDYAGRAVSETNNALKAEQALADGGVKVGDTWYNSIDEYLIASGNKAEPVEKISKTESYVGYYADVDGDKVADGVIYADLAFSKEANYWYGYSYEAVAAEELKDYYVSGTYDGDFNEEGTPKEVLTATGEGKDRFYVMALEDVTTEDYSTFYWYESAWENMSDYETATSTAFGTGKANTEKIKGYWEAETPYGTQNTRDLWAQIDLTNGWFVPSIAEWAAFADVWNINYENYSDYELSDSYWSSSQGYTDYAWYADFDDDCMYDGDVRSNYCVRLSATF